MYVDTSPTTGGVVITFYRRKHGDQIELVATDATGLAETVKKMHRDFTSSACLGADDLARMAATSIESEGLLREQFPTGHGQHLDVIIALFGENEDGERLIHSIQVSKTP